MTEIIQIAIDGPPGGGKSTIARLLAERLGFLYVDTGAMYRVVAYLGLLNNIALSNENALVDLLSRTRLDMRAPTEAEKADSRLVTVFVDGVDVSMLIRTPKISQASSQVAVLPKVRQALVAIQQSIVSGKSCVMEGRDIGSVVLPGAQLKIFFTASAEVRANRRLLQMRVKNPEITLEEVMAELLERDQRDTTRDASPLVALPEAWILDTSDMNIDEVAAKIEARVRELQAAT